MDDVTGAVDIPLAARVTMVNTWKADLYISIHHNAGGGTGIISFCYGGGSAKSFSFRDLIYQCLIDATGNCGNRAEPLATTNYYMSLYDCLCYFVFVYLLHKSIVVFLTYPISYNPLG